MDRILALIFTALYTQTAKLNSMNHKLHEMTILEKRPDGTVKIWNEPFTSRPNTEENALKYARNFFPDCVVVPARSVSLKPRGLFWYGVAAGFGITCMIFSLIAAYIVFTLSH